MCSYESKLPRQKKKYKYRGWVDVISIFLKQKCILKSYKENETF